MNGNHSRDKSYQECLAESAQGITNAMNILTNDSVTYPNFDLGHYGDRRHCILQFCPTVWKDFGRALKP
jgi:hypothetical protein